MRRFPRPSHTEPVTDGCMSSGILLVLTVICPPLGIIFLLFYAFLKDYIITDNFIITLQIIVLFLVLTLSPIITIISIFVFGFEETWKESALLVILTIIEVIVAIIYIIKNYNQKQIKQNETLEQENLYIEQEKLKQKEDEECIKEYKLNKPHVINIGLCNQFDNSTEISTQIDSSQSFSVFITPAKKKYHKHDCIHIKNRTDLTEINIKDAETSDIQPCKICFKNKI